jgi:hypothetical protein
MDIAGVVEIAVARFDEARVEVAALEPAEVSMEAVGGLAQLVTELMGNGLAFSTPEDRVTVTGVFEGNDYLISISDRGIGIPEHLIEGLNRMLERPESHPGADPKLGIALVARLAARHRIGVRLIPGAPGTTARVTVPATLVTAGPGRPGEGRLPARSERAVDVSRLERRASGVVAMSEEAREEAETFLERVFSSLVGRTVAPERPAATAGVKGNGRVEKSRPATRDTTPPVTTLRTRIPGENFSPVDDSPSTLAAERAIDIRAALTRYDEGRRSAEETDEPDSRVE